MTHSPPDTFRLFLLRHANAAWPGPGVSDFDRALDRKGQSDIRDVAIRAYSSGYSPDLIISSPARRCHETTAAVLDVFGAVTTEFDPTLYDDGPDAYLRQIDKNSGVSGLMLVGHNPMIEALASQFCSELPSELAFGYPTAGLLVIDFKRPAPPAFGGGLAVDVVAPL